MVFCLVHDPLSILFSAICVQFWGFMSLKHHDKEKGRKIVLKRESLQSVDWNEVSTKCQGPRPNITLSCSNGSNHNSSNSEVISLVHLTSFTNTMCFFSPFRHTYVNTMVFFVHPSGRYMLWNDGMLKLYFITIENTFKYNFYNEFLLPNGLVTPFFLHTVWKKMDLTSSGQNDANFKWTHVGVDCNFATPSTESRSTERN